MSLTDVTRSARNGLRLLTARAGLSQPPLISADIHLTQRCNLRCTYCSAPLQHVGELDTATWLRLIDEIAELGAQRLNILGGEPLLRADLGEVIAHARQRQLAVGLTSNGLLVPRRLDALRGLGHLTLSLDAPGPANDAVRGAGVFAAVEAALAAARGAGIPVKLNAVLSAVTAPHLDELLAFVARHDLSLTLNVVRSGAPDLWNDAASIKDDDGAIGALLTRLAELARHDPHLLFSPATYRYAAAWRDYDRDRVERGEWADDDPRLRDAPRCQRGRSALTINADGNVYPCVITFGRICGGNAARDGLAACWRALHDHPCLACYAPCLVEQNTLLNLHPPSVFHFARRHLGRFA
ncbi:MAG: radical SAM protein [Deltaproteobacteria bacterium]|nr:radical SAM protein [Deltaproteobacteria bacterium]